MIATHRTMRGIWFHSLALPYDGRPVLTGCATFLPSGTPIRLAADYGARFLLATDDGRLAYANPDDFERITP
jgi:hypothetical protein